MFEATEDCGGSAGTTGSVVCLVSSLCVLCDEIKSVNTKDTKSGHRDDSRNHPGPKNHLQPLG